MDVPQGIGKAHSVGCKSPSNSAPNSKPGSPKEEMEKFPAFTPVKIKSRSLTQMEVQAATISPEDLEEIAARLRVSDPPISLDEARERRASVKEDRKACVDFIKHRTSSRAAAMTRPDLETLQDQSPEKA